MRKLRIIASYLAMAVAAISLTRADGATVAAPIPIGYATTRITRPLTKNGLVDYVAAFNQRFGKGITPQNNAAVPLLILFRPQSFRGGSYTMAAGKMVYVENKNWGHKFRKALGISDRDLQGPQYIPLQEFLTKADYAAIGTARHLRSHPTICKALPVGHGQPRRMLSPQLGCAPMVVPWTLRRRHSRVHGSSCRLSGRGLGRECSARAGASRE